MPRIVGVLLAAGRGTRFGGAKLLAPLPRDCHGIAAGTPIGVAAAMHLVAALAESIAVVRPQDLQVSALLRATGIRVVECRDADNGMGASLACGVAAVSDADGWVVALADMPWIAPQTITAVADAIANGADIAAPSYRAERGHPVGFAKRHYAALRALRGDEGARAVVARAKEQVTLVELDDAGVVRDVDTPNDLTR
jgi:molybdenum cofactor cytidylyltransferase